MRLIQPFSPDLPPGVGSAFPECGPMAFACVDLAEISDFLQAGKDSGVEAEFLSTGEQRQFARFSLEKRRSEWLGGRIAAKWAAATLLGVAPPYWRQFTIAAEASGRPFLQTDHPAPGLFISISHSGPLAAAMAAKISCGLDIQRIVPKILALHSRFANEREEELLQGKAPALSREELLSLLWAAKEAVRKMLPISPLAGLLELQLVAAKNGPGKGEEPLLLALRLKRKNTALTREIPVLAWLVDDLAWAITALPNSSGE